MAQISHLSFLPERIFNKKRAWGFEKVVYTIIQLFQNPMPVCYRSGLRGYVRFFIRRNSCLPELYTARKNVQTRPFCRAVDTASDTLCTWSLVYIFLMWLFTVKMEMNNSAAIILWLKPFTR